MLCSNSLQENVNPTDSKNFDEFDDFDPVSGARRTFFSMFKNSAEDFPNKEKKQFRNLSL